MYLWKRTNSVKAEVFVGGLNTGDDINIEIYSLANFISIMTGKVIMFILGKKINLQETFLKL